MVRKTALIIVLFSLSIINPRESVFGDEVDGVGSYLSIRGGVERLEYEEDEPVTGIASRAEVYNAVLGVDGAKRWERLFLGIRGIFPVIPGDDTERWSRSGTLSQTNNLKSKWTRFDGYMGYPLASWLNPYAGIRYSYVEQDRKDFIVTGTPTAGSAREKVSSFSLLLGLRGKRSVSHRWGWSYWIDFFLPIDVEVTNSAFPGFKASEKEGYTLELKTGIEHTYSEGLTLGLTIFGGKMHWDGSGFKPFAGGAAKWPENDTHYLGGTIHIGWTI